MNNYLFMDGETAETPKVNGQLDITNGQVYDLGLLVMNDEEEILDKISLINEDVFFRMPIAMQNAYFAEKIPQYLKEMRMGQRKIVNTWEMYHIFHNMCKQYNITAILAHNASFDISTLNATMRYQTKSKCRWFLPYGIEVIDTMKMAMNTFAKDPQYINWCKENNYMTNHKVPRPRVTAEILYRYITNDHNFKEEHTGLEDVMIEKEIFLKCRERI